METPRVIFVDDESCFQQGLQLSLNTVFGPNPAFKAEFYSHPSAALEAIKANPFNVFLVFMDHHFREGSEKLTLGADFIKPIKRVNGYIEIIMMSGDTSPESLRLWLKNGADKFVYKEFSGQHEKLQIFISEALTKFRSKFSCFLDQRKHRVGLVPEALKKIGVVSMNPIMKASAELVLQSAASDLSVLIIGETGTGKELIAKAIHQNSKRRDKQFRTIDCTQFKKSELIASELFGSERGAFTGAESKAGLLEIANGGTVFLDEVHHLGAEAQAMLLRFIQERKVRRVGGNVEKFVDVRLVFAAKPALKDLVAGDEFLVDLMYRMKEIKIDLPKLTDRPDRMSSNLFRQTVFADHLWCRTSLVFTDPKASTGLKFMPSRISGEIFPSLTKPECVAIRKNGHDSKCSHQDCDYVSGIYSQRQILQISGQALCGEEFSAAPARSAKPDLGQGDKVIGSANKEGRNISNHHGYDFKRFGLRSNQFQMWFSCV